MAIYLHHWKDHDYWRIARSWNNQEHQTYVKIARKNPEKSRTKAEEIDATFKARQKAFYSSQTYQVAYHINSQGKIRGIQRSKIKRPNRLKTDDIFRIRANPPWEERTFYTTISIDKHLLFPAFQLAVYKYLEFYSLQHSQELLQQLTAAFQYYSSTVLQLPTKTSPNALQSDLEHSLKSEIQAFTKRPKNLIDGRS